MAGWRAAHAGALPFSSSCVVVEQLEPGIVLMRRTREPLPDGVLELQHFYEELHQLFGRLPTDELDLIVDSRLAPGRNDETFERVQTEYRERIFCRFRRTVIVMGTVAGRLQVARYAREQPGYTFHTYPDVPSAVEALRRPPSTRRSLAPVAG